MSAMSDYMEGALIDHFFRGSSITAPSTVYIALFTSTASAAELEAGTLTNEVADANAYARKSISTSGGTEFAAPTAGDGVTSNTNPITFATATGGAWGTIRYAAVMDSPTRGSGNVLFYGQLLADRVISDTDTFQFNAGDFILTFA